MKIVFIGNFQKGPGGEDADETHLTRELERAGHEIYRIPRDEWREYVIEQYPKDKYKVPENIQADIVIICKWHHFYDGGFIDSARLLYNAPVFYWVWDWMDNEDWHMKMAKAADLYLSGELGSANHYRSNGIKFYYFQFDSCDGDFPSMSQSNKEIDVAFLGSCSNQYGKLDLLKEINKKAKITIFGYDWEEWIKHGFEAHPAAYGMNFNKIVAASKIVLGTSAAPNCFGYWSNRVGKVLHAGGFLLQQYTPGMESFLMDCCDYFSSADEAIEKIRYYLEDLSKRDPFLRQNILMNRDRWTSEIKIKQLLILIDRFRKDQKGMQWQLP